MTETGPRLLNHDDLVARRITQSQKHLKVMENAGLFPKRVRLGALVAWVETEIDDYLRAQVAKRDLGEGTGGGNG